MRLSRALALLILPPVAGCEKLNIFFPEDCDTEPCETPEEEVAYEDWDTRSDDPTVPTARSCGDIGADLDLPDPSPCGGGAAAWLASDDSTYATVQGAIDAAEEGDTVTVCPGTWTEALSIGEAHGDLTLRGYGFEDSILSGGDVAQVLTASQTGTLTVRGLSIKRGSSTYEGGGLMLTGADTVLDGVLVANNTADYTGGGLSALGRSLTLHDTCFRGNTADHEAGALSVYSSSSLEIRDSVFIDNSAGGEDGGVLDYGGREDEGLLVIIGSTFKDNSTAGAGGAVAIGSYEFTEVWIRDSVFDGNHSGDEGGAIEASSYDGSRLHIRQTLFTGNSADGHGGALMVGGWGSHYTVLTDTWITGNTSGDVGGGFYVGGRGSSDLLMRGGAVTQNSTEAQGGGADFNSGSSIQVIDSDWGEGSTDNTPQDVHTVGGFGAGASFACNSATCG